jgi:hypothetical protein
MGVLGKDLMIPVTSGGDKFFMVGYFPWRIIARFLGTKTLNLASVSEWLRSEALDKPQIVIAETPDDVSRRLYMALIGGGVHEALHRLLSRQGRMEPKEALDFLVPRVGTVDWAKHTKLLLDWQNLLEDIAIERIGNAMFPGIYTKMCDLADFIIDQEAESRKQPGARITMATAVFGTFREFGLGYNTDKTQEAVDAYRAASPEGVKMVLQGTLAPLLRKAIPDVSSPKAIETARAELLRGSSLSLAMEVVKALLTLPPPPPPPPPMGGQGGGKPQEKNSSGQGSQGQDGKTSNPKGNPGKDPKISDPKSNGSKEGEPGKGEKDRNSAGDGNGGTDKKGNEGEGKEPKDSKGGKGKGSKNEKQGESKDSTKKGKPGDETPEEEGPDGDGEGDDDGDDEGEGDDDGEGEGQAPGKGTKPDGKKGENSGGKGKGGDTGEAKDPGKGKSGKDGQGKGSGTPSSGEGSPGGSSEDEGGLGQETLGFVNTEGTNDQRGGLASGGGATTPKTLDQFLRDFAKNGSGIKDSSTSLESALKKEKKIKDSLLAKGESPYRPFSTASDLTEMVKTPIDGSQKDTNRKAATDRVKALTTVIRTRLPILFRGYEDGSRDHGIRRGPILSERMLVDARCELKAGSDPSRAFAEDSITVDMSLSVVVVIDESGSMAKRLADTAGVVHALGTTLDSVGAKSMILGFRDNGAIPKPFGYPYNPGLYHRVGGITYDIFKRWNERFLSVYRRLGNITASGGTPMSDGVEYGLQELSHRNETHRVLIVVTDGCPDVLHAPVIKNQLRRAAEAGIMTVGVGIGQDARYVTSLFPDGVHSEDVVGVALPLLKKFEDLVRRVGTGKRGRAVSKV